MFDLTDTIVAIATPPGEGATGMIRLSGDDAIAIANKIFSGKDLTRQATHTLHFGKIMDGDTVIDEVVAGIYIAPKSYTGEHIAEISCHGSDYILRQVMNLCMRHGARLAKPGEFTLRAFLKGKMDLTQAEAVADLIASHSGTAHRAAMHNLRGGFSEDLGQMREQLIMFSALIELELDFSEEDVEFADRAKFHRLVDALTFSTQQLVDSFRLGNVIKNGVRVAIVGAPNAGKSTLLNALLNEDRAIVSEIAGTTRDTIEEALNINGILFRLIDTAGIREHSLDAIELKGMERSVEAMNKADIVIYLFDVQSTLPDTLHKQKLFFEQASLNYLLADNKVDTAGQAQLSIFNAISDDILYISAKTKAHIPQLKEALFNAVSLGSVKQEGTIVTNARHYGTLLEVLRSLHDIKAGLDAHISGDLISLDIRTCLHHLGEITGAITTEDKLDYIFSKFCIGK